MKKNAKYWKICQVFLNECLEKWKDFVVFVWLPNWPIMIFSFIAGFLLGDAADGFSSTLRLIHLIPSTGILK